MSQPLRVALFTDSFEEANGVATLSRHLAQYAQQKGFPFLVVYGGNQTRPTRDGLSQTLQLRRGPGSFPLDKNLYCDPFLMRHKAVVLDQLREFNADLVQITGPGDLGFMGFWAAHRAHVPFAASWHTNLHQYLGRRLDGLFSFLPEKLRTNISFFAEHQSLRGLLRFYRTARFILAPNQPMVNMLQERTTRPAYLMGHGVDLHRFSPSPCDHLHQPFTIGYVGRLTLEKNVRLFATLEKQLLAAGMRNFKFLLVGEGGQRDWLAEHLKDVELPGLLRGDALTHAYNRMSAFVFPSSTDTFGLVLLEALASGLPVITHADSGVRIGLQHGYSGFLGPDFSVGIRALMTDNRLRCQMSAAARDLACSQSWNRVFDELYKTYRIALSVPDSRHPREPVETAVQGN